MGRELCILPKQDIPSVLVEFCNECTNDGGGGRLDLCRDINYSNIIINALFNTINLVSLAV